MGAGDLIQFRTRGGPTHGWGNVHRLADFADFCRARGHDRIRFVVEGPESVPQYLRQRGFEALYLGDEATLADEARTLDANGRALVTIAEMLECHPARQRLLREHSGRLVVFDDLFDHAYDADLVVCGQALPHYGNVQLCGPDCRFLLGYDYFLFGGAYRERAAGVRRLAERPAEVLVAFGGGSYDIAYQKTARALARLDQPLSATFVLGFAAEDALKAEIRELLPAAKILGGVDDMPERLWRADLAVVSGGYLKLEAALLRTPAVIIATQWHQIPLAEEFQAHTDALYLGYMGFVETDAIAEAIAALQPQATRARLTEKAAAVVDGHGIERVYDAIFAGGQG